LGGLEDRWADRGVFRGVSPPDTGGMDRAGFESGGVAVIGVGRSLAASPLPVCAAITGYALLAGLARPLTAPALVTVLLPGTLLLWAGARRPPRRTLLADRTTASVWHFLAR
jgi:hypothetical protein